MSNIASTVVAIIASSAFTGSMIAVVVKAIVEKKLQSHFDHLLLVTKHRHEQELAELSAQLEGTKKLQERFGEERFEACSKLADAIYRSRNLCRTLLSRTEVHESLVLYEEFTALASHLSDLLFRYRIAIDEELFSHLHDYKETLFAIRLALQLQESTPGGDEQLTVAAREAYNLLDRSYLPLISELRGRVQSNSPRRDPHRLIKPE